MHPLTRITGYIVLYWFTQDIVSTVIWRLAEGR